MNCEYCETPSEDAEDCDHEDLDDRERERERAYLKSLERENAGV